MFGVRDQFVRLGPWIQWEVEYKNCCKTIQNPYFLKVEHYHEYIGRYVPNYFYMGTVGQIKHIVLKQNSSISNKKHIFCLKKSIFLYYGKNLDKDLQSIGWYVEVFPFIFF